MAEFRLVRALDHWASSPFQASSPAELQAGIRSAWDEHIAACAHPGSRERDPDFAFRDRIAELDEWLAKKLQTKGATKDAIVSWKAEVDRRKATAASELGERPVLDLHVRVREEWVIPGQTDQAPRVARIEPIETCEQLWARADKVLRMYDGLRETHARHDAARSKDQVLLRLPPGYRDRLKALAEARGSTVVDLVCQWIDDVDLAK